MKEKMVLGFLCVAVILGLAGCNAQQPMTVEDKTDISAGQVSDTTMVDKSSVEVPSDGASDITEPTAKAEIPVEEKKVEENKTENGKNPPTPSESATDTATKPTESSKPIVPPAADSPPKAEPEPSPVPKPIRYADADDCKAIADLVVEYINGYRESPATKLPGLTAYAEYRSRQIVTNFAHDTLDERTAATALKYGEYVEPSLYGMTGEPYFTANARDAIGRAGYRGTVEYVAEQLALQFKNSAGHWAYVGDAKYRYIAVGVTYDGGMWYCDVSVALENTDNL